MSREGVEGWLVSVLINLMDDKDGVGAGVISLFSPLENENTNQTRSEQPSMRNQGRSSH